MVKMLRDFGLTSEVAYIAGMVSIVMSILAWAGARRKDDKASAQRWGIFVGLWAPTFIELGNALKVEEES